jgi:hypothetical protein
MLTDDPGRIQAVAVELLARGEVAGKRFRVGLNVEANPRTHEWAVDRAGKTMVLAHDAFEAARWFLRLESGQISTIVEPPYELESDAESAARQSEQQWVFEAWRAEFLYPESRRKERTR